MFSHYSKWIYQLSQKIHPLVVSERFPLEQLAVKAFEKIKQDLSKAVAFTIEDNVPFVVKTDASDQAIAATLSQNGRPVAFFSRTLTNSERKHSSIEKEVYAIVESLHKWRHYLLGKHFQLITGQQSVSFMFDGKGGGE